MRLSRVDHVLHLGLWAVLCTATEWREKDRLRWLKGIPAARQPSARLRWPLGRSGVCARPDLWWFGDGPIAQPVRALRWWNE